MTVDRPFEQMNDHPFFHGYTLGNSSNPTIVPHMLQLLNHGGPQTFYAAFTLSLHDNDQGRIHLEKAALEGTNPFLALVGLSCLPIEKTLCNYSPLCRRNSQNIR